MTMNPLPPQAYTKETLLKAYHWLQQQTPSIREMAMTPDIMVSLYLKASRDGEQALERPSIQNFKSELRSLAGLMGELEGPPTPTVTASFETASERPSAPASAPLSTPKQDAPTSFSPAPAPTIPATPTMAAPAAAPIQSAPLRADPPKQETRLGLDPKSLEMLREIREDFNLSNDSEALRMLVKIGYTKAKTLI